MKKEAKNKRVEDILQKAYEKNKLKLELKGLLKPSWKPNDDEWVEIIGICIDSKYAPVMRLLLENDNSPITCEQVENLMKNENQHERPNFYSTVSSLNARLKRCCIKCRLRIINPKDGSDAESKVCLFNT